MSVFEATRKNTYQAGAVKKTAALRTFGAGLVVAFSVCAHPALAAAAGSPSLPIPTPTPAPPAKVAAVANPSPSQPSSSATPGSKPAGAAAVERTVAATAGLDKKPLPTLTVRSSSTVRRHDQPAAWHRQATIASGNAAQ